MATYNNVVATKSATLVAATIDTVNFTLRPRYLTVTNTGTGTIYCRADGQAPSSTGANDGDIAVVAGVTVVVPTGDAYDPVTGPLTAASIQLVSAGTPTYTVAH